MYRKNSGLSRWTLSPVVKRILPPFPLACSGPVKRSELVVRGGVTVSDMAEDVGKG